MPARHIHVRPTAAQLKPALDTVRTELHVPGAYPADAVLEAETVAARGPVVPPDAPTTVDDLTDLPFVTIDPAGSRDLDQAYTASRRDGGGYRVHYAIADVHAFVAPGGLLDAESRARGVTLYQPDQRTPLYPEVLGQGAASLLPDERRQAVVWTIDLDGDGEAVGDPRFRRALVRSRRQLSYPEAQREIDAGTADDALALLREIGRLREDRERDRGGISLNLPAQEVVVEDGHADLRFVGALPVEGWNAQISLLTGIVASRVMLAGGVGILRTMPPPDEHELGKLRLSARALGVVWEPTTTYPAFVRTLDPATTVGAVLLNRAARTLRGAGYTAFDGEAPADPRHSAVASTYAHVTAPLRRLADRFANEVLLALVAGTDPPGWARAALPALPEIMATSGRRERSLERAIIDAAEALLLADRVGDVFDATVIAVDPKYGATVQVASPAVVGPLDDPGAKAGVALRVRLAAVDVARRTIRFVPAS